MLRLQRRDGGFAVGDLAALYHSQQLRKRELYEIKELALVGMRLAAGEVERKIEIQPLARKAGRGVVDYLDKKEKREIIHGLYGEKAAPSQYL